jgi:hypothetical protein
MLTAQAQVHTDQAERYLTQFCKHATGMANSRAHRLLAHAAGGAVARGEVRLRAECTASHGVVEFEPWGLCSMSATRTGLLVRVEAKDESSLRRMQEIIGNDLERFGRRDGLVVQWHVSEVPSHSERQPDPVVDTTAAPLAGQQARRVPLMWTAGGLALAAVIGMHLVVAGAATAIPHWLGWTAAGLLVVPGGLGILHAAAPLSAVGLHQRLSARGRRARRADLDESHHSPDPS